MSISYEGEIIQKDPRQAIQKMKVMLASKDAEIGAWILAYNSLEEKLRKKDEELDERGRSLKFYRDRLATANIKLKKFGQNES